MTFTIESAQAIFSDTQVRSPIPATIAQFEKLDVDDKLALLWYAYTEMGRSITPAAVGAARLQFAESLLHQFRHLSSSDQLQAMRDLANRAETPVSLSYGAFSVNTKLAFWYELGELMKQGIVAPVPSGYQMTAGVKALLETIQKLDAGQQITVLRNAVVDMGFSPDVAPSTDKEPLFARTQAPTQIEVAGITEPTIVSYLEALNKDDFETAIALFTEDGALQPPFQKPIIGHQAIARYMRAEAQGLNIMPSQGISDSLADGSKQFKVTGIVQTPWFGVNVGMNVSWRFLLNPEGKIYFVAIDMLASPQELLNLSIV